MQFHILSRRHHAQRSLPSRAAVRRHARPGKATGPRASAQGASDLQRRATNLRSSPGSSLPLSPLAVRQFVPIWRACPPPIASAPSACSCPSSPSGSWRRRWSCSRCCVAARRGQTLRFGDTEAFDACPHLRERELGACTAVCVPVSVMRKVVGVIHAVRPMGEALIDTAAPQLEAISTQVGTRMGIMRAAAE